jgi:transcriptional regulator with XRE-family HTH domain
VRARTWFSWCVQTLAAANRMPVTTSPVARGVAKVPSRPHARFGAYLSKLMEAQGLSNTELARRAEVQHSSVGRWKDGAERPSVDFLRKIAPVLQKTHGELIVAAGYSTPEELGMVTTELPSHPKLAAIIREVNREVGHASVTEADADQLIGAVVDMARRVLKLWREMRPPREEPKMRESRPAEKRTRR